jgi:hypothetical protein
MKYAVDYVQIGEISMYYNKISWIIGVSILLSACSYLPFSTNSSKEVKYVKDPRNPNRLITEAEAKKTGKVDLFNLGSKEKVAEGYQEKNYFLWSACVDVLSGLPTKISDANGGIYTTEFVPNAQGVLQSIQCRVTGKKVLSNNIIVTVFTKNQQDLSVTESDNNAIKSNILIRAKELKAQYDESV